MQDVRMKIIKILIENAKKQGLEVDEKGYVNSLEENLVERFGAWDEIKQALEQGDGNELSCNGSNKPKFCALHSSAALCVNSFMPFIEYTNQLPFLHETNYPKIEFEKKLQTGISTPNVDVLLENEAYSIGVESKFLETLSVKKTKSLQTYIKRKKSIDSIPESFFDMIQRYLDKNYEGYLDVSQLIKHTLGLIKYAKIQHTRPKLVYIYWTPKADGFLPSSFQKHNEELKSFSEDIRPFIDFTSMSYEDLWDDMEKSEKCSDYMSKIRDKYQISLPSEA